MRFRTAFLPRRWNMWSVGVLLEAGGLGGLEGVAIGVSGVLFECLVR